MQPKRVTTSLDIGLVLGSALTLTGCAAVEGIFKAGFWVGVVVVALALAGVFGIVRLINR